MNAVKAHLAVHIHVQIPLAAITAHAGQGLFCQRVMNRDVKASKLNFISFVT